MTWGSAIRACAIRTCALGSLSLILIAGAQADPDVQASSTPEPKEVGSAPAATGPSPEDSVAPTADAGDDCAAAADCIDRYLWSLYERAPKVDAVRIVETRKVTVKRKGKSRTVVVSVARYADEDFAWKDVAAAGMNGMPLMTYVIGGMDRDFKRTLYIALRRMDEASLMPGITSAFRDDYRQTIASGNKAQADRSYHGGSARGGYGHGRAVDLVSVMGATRAERFRASRDLWTWIDANGAEVGIGRPYRDRDAPHVALIGGEEYAKHRGSRSADARTADQSADAKTTDAKTTATESTGRQAVRNESRHGRRAGASARVARGATAKANTGKAKAAKATAAGATKAQRPAATANGRARQVGAPQPVTRSRT
jgi:hypothetical protein